ASRSIRTSTAGTSGIAPTAVLTSPTILSTTSGLADAAVSVTVTPENATSMSLTMPKDTMSRLNPGYLIFFSSASISLGLGIPVRRFEEALSLQALWHYQCRPAMLSFPDCGKNDVIL